MERIIANKVQKEGEMYRQGVPRDEQPRLRLHVEVLITGSVILRGYIPDELEPKVMVALRNAQEKKVLKEGRLEILLPCLQDTCPREKARRIMTFCRWLTRRSEIRIIAQI